MARFAFDTNRGARHICCPLRQCHAEAIALCRMRWVALIELLEDAPLRFFVHAEPVSATVTMALPSGSIPVGFQAGGHLGCRSISCPGDAKAQPPEAAHIPPFPPSFFSPFFPCLSKSRFTARMTRAARANIPKIQSMTKTSAGPGMAASYLTPSSTLLVQGMQMDAIYSIFRHFSGTQGSRQR